MRFLRPLRAVSLLAILGLVAAGCTPAATTSQASSAAATASLAAGTVNVTLQEFSVNPDAATAPAGEVTFHVTNQGPDDVHEFVIIKTDLGPNALPTAEDGSVDEEGEGIEVVDEIEDIPVGETKDLTVSLDAGPHVLICNIVEEDEAHYAIGMRTAFTVT
jgi:uncharacterized cupredoxin-like copper-binding protein